MDTTNLTSLSQGGGGGGSNCFVDRELDLFYLTLFIAISVCLVK